MSENRADKFTQVHAEWLAALAAQVKVSFSKEAPGGLDGDERDEAIKAVVERVGKAERQLVLTPAVRPSQFVDKFEAMEAIMAERERSGRPGNNRHMLMLASVKADLYCFRLSQESE